MVLPLIIQEPFNAGFAFSVISVEQWIILILGQISEAQLANSEDACGSIMGALVFSFMPRLHVPPNPFMSPFPCYAALKSRSTSFFHQLIEKIVLLLKVLASTITSEVFLGYVNVMMELLGFVRNFLQED